MKQFLKTLGLFLLLHSSNLLGQNCGSDELHNSLMQNDNNYRNAFDQLQNSVYESQLNHNQNRRRQQFVVPLVIHVLHLGEPIGSGSNISDSQILDAVQGLNDRFSNAIGNGQDIELEFCLASRDPNACPSNGINRVDASFIQEYVDFGIGNYCDSAASASTMKDLSKWPVSDYYNIWVVHRIPREDCSQVWGGYAFYPNGNPYDGTVMRATSMNYFSSTLAHELGHGFNLFHTFNDDGGDQFCPDNTDCLLDGDRVCDTPPHKQTDCGASNPCTASGIWNNSLENYMSYCFPSQADGRFTQGQKDRIVATFQSFPRNNLLNSLGCTVPELAISFSKTDATCDSLCDGSITANTACNLDFTYSWNTGDTTQTIDFLCAGTYSVTLTDQVTGFIDSASTSVGVKPLPTNVSIEIPAGDEVVCIKVDMVSLNTFASPSGGVFSGDGVNSNGNFYPQVAGAGMHVISYKFPNVSIDECAVFVRDTIWVDECIGVEENALKEQIKLTPNPVRDELYVNWPQDILVREVAIYDFSGKQIKMIELQDGNSLKVNVSSLPQGIYFLKLNDYASESIKFLKLDQAF